MEDCHFSLMERDEFRRYSQILHRLTADFVRAVPGVAMRERPPQSPGHDPYPVAVAFDNSGNLWFGMLAGLSVGEYTAAQIAAGGNPAPAILFNLKNGLSPTAIAFDPHNLGLPLH